MKIIFFSFFMLLFVFGKLVGQTLPPSTSCTSKDLELRSVKLAYTGLCFPYGQPTNVILEINNKTGSVRTSFACWAKLVRTSKEGVEQAPVPVFICGGPIQPSSVTSIVTSFQITVNEGEALILKDLFLAWTTSNTNQTCDYLKNNSATINPKCGVLPSIVVQAGVTGALSQSAPVCSSSGSLTNITVTPTGGIAPYKVSIDGGTEYDVVANASYTFSSINATAVHTIRIKDKNGCLNTANSTISNTTPVVANAGSDFTKNCIVNLTGNTIGESSTTGFTYTWSPSSGLSSATIANPTANPTETTIYTVTKTNTASGCASTDQVTVTVDNATVTADAGSDFAKTCLTNLIGNTIGESSASGFTYAWSPSSGLSSANVANPTANPTETTVYRVTKTNTSSGCVGTDDVTVTVNNASVTANAGGSFTKTCIDNLTGKTVGETSVSGFEYAWSPTEGLSSSTISNPIANPSQSTTYTLTKTNSTSGCYGTSQVTVNVSDTKPTFSVTLVQPTVSLCSAATLGSVTFCASGGSGLEYSITDGNVYTSSSSFTDLSSGAVTGYKVRNSDGCVTSASCASVSSCSSTSAAPVNAVIEGSVLVKSVQPSLLDAKPTVKAYPNPFNGQVNFNIQTPIAGNSVLEVFDAMGRKIGVVFQGKMNAGEIRTLPYSLPVNYNGTLIYRFSVGQQMTNGKLISSGKKTQNRP